MPLYLKPNMRAAISLRIDEHDDPRPTFYARALSMDEQIALGNKIDEMHSPEVVANKTLSQLFDDAIQLLERYIDDWDNLPDDFSLRNLTYHEVRELLSKVAYGQSLNFEEKKS